MITEKGGNYHPESPKPLRISSAAMKIALPLLTLQMWLAGCTPRESSSLDSDNVIATAQSLTEMYLTETAQPTAITTESPTPTETPEPRVPSQTIDEIFARHLTAEAWLDHGFGSYFSTKSELENPEQNLYLDYSHQGEIRIVEWAALDGSSWGLFTPKVELEGVGIITKKPVSYFLNIQLLVDGRETKVVWGDLVPGTTFFLADAVLRGASTEEIAEGMKKRVLPIGDPRFKCTKVDSFYVVGYYDIEKFPTPGTACAYIG